MSYAVAVDIGGTFTDLVAYDHESHRVVYTKSPTTYDNLVEGIVSCFGKAGLTPEQATYLNHGTTLVINAFIQRRGAKAALVTSQGFRDILEIARGNRPDPFDLYYRRDEPLIPRSLRFEVPERIDAKGQVIVPLDIYALEALAGSLREFQVEAVAVFFMSSYINPAHEEVAAQRLRELLPGVYVTCSTELTREWYEYERMSTVAANAYVGPQVNTYIRHLESDMQRRGFGGSLFMMGSNGGLLSVNRTCKQPIGLVESGPIGGCIGAGAYAEALGFGNVVAFDMGGTTAKCALVKNGRFNVDHIYYAGGYVRGFPIKSPVIDIVEVGSGGGSIAWLDSQTRLHVGPKSAGSTPGPVCYGRGGEEPTITDANLAMGRLNAGRFLGGELKLDTELTNRAIRKIAEPLGYYGEEGVLRMSDGILSIATVIMAGAIRQVSVEHGLDPRDFVLFSYGGGGPLHASALAHELSIPTVVVPPAPGNFSAIGMLLADARLDTSKTFTGVLTAEVVSSVQEVFSKMETEAAAALGKEFGAQEVFFERHAEMRYVGQRHNIDVPISNVSDVAAIRTAFERDYKRRYGHADAKAMAEVQALHLSAFARQRRPDLRSLPEIGEADSKEPSRPVYFGHAGGCVTAKIYQRSALAPGFAAEGPVVIEEYGSTTLVMPGDRFEIGPLREIRVHCGGKVT
ncbi:MAG: 5-oxoprolinase [Betaproteobacteria bacterium RIFCSPLOWO2_12_FULL_63_13]|nr:MAG: 5-oxoprolinase [Betaproteobacteria bacterium RIFCSPLOWO2_12_FULL_63_13]